MGAIAREESRIPLITLCLLLSILKGKLAHNSMTFYLVFISCLLDMTKKFTKEKNTKYNLICFYRGKKNKFGNPFVLGFPISPLATSLKGEFPLNKKGCPCVKTPCMLN